jgi:hypothetical protein
VQSVPCTAAFSNLLFFSIRVLTISYSSVRALWKISAETNSSEAWGKLGDKCQLILQMKYLRHMSFNMPQNLWT